MNFNKKDKADKILKTDTSYLVKSGSWVGIGLFVSSLLAFFSAVAFANLLDARIYGTYKYVISIVSILYIFTLTGTGTAISQAVAKGYEGSFLKIVKTKIKWGLLGAISALGLSSYYFFKEDLTLTLAFILAAPFIPFIESFLSYNAFLGGKREFKTQTQYSTIISIVATLSLVITLFLTKNLFTLLAVYFLSYTLLRFFFLVRALKKYRPNKKELPRTVTYGKHLSFIDALSIVAGSIETFLIFHFIGATSLAIYIFATVPIMQLKFINKIIKPLALPKFALRKKEELKNTLNRKIFLFASLTTVIVVLYIIFAPYLFSIFFPKYLESIPITRIAVIALIAGASTIIPTSILQAHAKTKQLYALQILESMFSIILPAIMIILWGLIGLAISRVIIRFMVFGSTLVLSKKYLAS